MMKIVDYGKKDIAVLPLAFLYFSSFFIVGPFINPALRRIGPELISMIIVFAITMACLCVAYTIILRSYVINANGIQLNMLWGKLSYFFTWEQFVSFSVYKAGYALAEPVQPIIVLSCSSKNELPKRHKIKGIFYYLVRYKSIVAIKFTVERYEYIRQFCDLPLVDNR